MPAPAADNHWQDFARKWNRLGSPLRPCPEDVENFRKAIGNDPGRCLLLGVTPELTDLDPSLIAIDNSTAMIAALWTGRHTAIQGDWLDLPFPEDSFDTLIGDGCLTLLSHPAQYAQFFEQLGRVVAPGGKVVLRLFVSAARKESAEAVCREALNGKMKSFHAFKWRLSMAIASEYRDHTFRVAETLATFDRLIPDRTKLASATRWHMDDIETIDFYRDSTALYSYPTLDHVRQTIHPSLKETDLIVGRYELADRCPILILQSKK
ncbi:MAG: class I SAM-dependent methyltransferase [Sideroxydans sp.]|jgi:SAM-dependent methyltransferase